MRKQRYKEKIVTLREKKLSNNRLSLYLDVYVDGNRHYEFLKIYLYEKPQNLEERSHNNDMLRLAAQIRSNRENDLKHQEYGEVSPIKTRVNFLDYFASYIQRYEKKDIRMMHSTLKQFTLFLSEEYNKDYIIPKELKEELIERFMNYLLKKFNGQTPSSYFKRFKKVVRYAYREGFFRKNPAEFITCPVQEGISKAILDFDEIKRLAAAPCGNPNVKKAFLFCLNTGLRYVDVSDLRWKEISGDILRRPQQKTGKEVVVYLNKTALALLGERGKPEDKVFVLPTIFSCIRTLKHWAKKAGIEKNLTWHSARHSFTVNLLIHKTDIKTVSSLLGHSSLKHTEKYTHVVDELKKKAVKSLPGLDL